MTNDLRLSVCAVIELYSLRWQIELFFKELKSTLGFHQYQFQKFRPPDLGTGQVEGRTSYLLAEMRFGKSSSERTK